MIRLKMHVTASLMKPLTMPLMHPLKMPLATRPSLTHLTPFLNMLPLTTPLMLRTTSPYTRNANADTTSYLHVWP